MPAETRIAARHVWTPAGLRTRCAVVLDATDRILSVEAARPDDLLLEGILMPGFVNTHGRLALSHHTRPVGRRGLGTSGWQEALSRVSPSPDEFTAVRGARSARATGSAFFIDASHTGATAPAMAQARLRGSVQIACSDLPKDQWQTALHAAHRCAPTEGVDCRPTAHTPTSCAPGLLVAALVAGPVPVTISCEEETSNRALSSAAPSGVALLSELGLLRRDVGLVHLAGAKTAELDLLRGTGCTVILCPRASLHVTGTLPDVTGMVQRGIPLALGTDSRARTPDLDLLAEAATLRAAFPELPATLWLHALTSGGARLIPGPPEAGRIDRLARPDLLLLEVPDGPELLERLLDGTKWPRRWLT